MRSCFPTAIAFTLICASCGPDIPDTIDHQDVGEAECSECHFYSVGTPPPESHWEGDEPNSSYDGCLRCHNFE